MIQYVKGRGGFISISDDISDQSPRLGPTHLDDVWEDQWKSTPLVFLYHNLFLVLPSHQFFFSVRAQVLFCTVTLVHLFHGPSFLSAPPPPGYDYITRRAHFFFPLARVLNVSHPQKVCTDRSTRLLVKMRTRPLPLFTTSTQAVHLQWIALCYWSPIAANQGARWPKLFFFFQFSIAISIEEEEKGYQRYIRRQGCRVHHLGC